jgi:hypothetical protein
MVSRRTLDRVQQDGFDHLERFDSEGDPTVLRAAADAWRWVAESTSDIGQRSFVSAAISVAMRRYFDKTKELWALREAVETARTAVTTEPRHDRWLMACIYLGIADYTYYATSGERPFLDDAIAVLRSAAEASRGAESRGAVLSHLVVALEKAHHAGGRDEVDFLVESVDVGREAARIRGPLQVDSAIDLMRNLGDLSYVRKDLDLLREAESIGRSFLDGADPATRGRVLFALARTLQSIGLRTEDATVLADALEAGEASVVLCPNPVDQNLRAVVVDGIRQDLNRKRPPEQFPLPPL